MVEQILDRTKTASDRTELGNELAVILLWRLRFNISRQCLPSNMVSPLSGSVGSVPELTSRARRWRRESARAKIR